MTDDDSNPAMFPSAFAKAMGQAGSDATETSAQMTEAMLDAAPTPETFPLEAVQGTATFKTRIQSGGRISIPDAEREVLDLGEGDIVQAVIVPLKRNQDND
ncbi:AbrB/MazE/SpoVT family DNA-binding domain-containing protein [Halodesulfurarchaeum sp. HSR-GB]|uniref:AbrB/MazE/SpoVT family DNA-binding domain-containing protein n=1 Tax=Halodesulfurarchaeum sp. HSR-GB TaxID=3074077 RepID=UPI00285BDBA5|nr:AbrB/MazE/SpoVT family DNA-binding domain-containing protein [Halodesulfurarchaeum sp. HSR-GB]MDR5656386.1 AbrB/MazE/SpoVT family DNA-binding domain-containing protein [Halodesulfurarchaeum sp. HSR-GB]